MLTYGDAVADIDINRLLEFHQQHGKIATITAVDIGQKFGVLEIDSGGKVDRFREKESSDGNVINGGFMVLNSEIFDYLEDDTTVFEKDPIDKLTHAGELMAYRHTGFWQCMDTQRDKMKLEGMIAEGNAPWMIWDKQKQIAMN